MSDAEYRGLRDSIAADGLHEEIVTHEGRILDGRHRYRACMETGVTPRFRAYSGDAPLLFVIAQNIHRRHLTITQRADLGIRLRPEIARETAEHHRRIVARNLVQNASRTAPIGAVRESEASGSTDEQVSKIVGIGERTFQRAVALEKNAPALYEKMVVGEMTITGAYDQMRETEPQATASAPRLYSLPAPVKPPKQESIDAYKRTFRLQEKEARALRDRIGDLELEKLSIEASIQQKATDRAALKVSQVDREKSAEVRRVKGLLAVATGLVTVAEFAQAFNTAPGWVQRYTDEAANEGAAIVRRVRATDADPSAQSDIAV